MFVSLGFASQIRLLRAIFHGLGAPNPRVQTLRVQTNKGQLREVRVLPIRVQIPNNYVLGFRIIVTIVQVRGKYMIIRYLDTQGSAG